MPARGTRCVGARLGRGLSRWRGRRPGPRLLGRRLRVVPPEGQAGRPGLATPPPASPPGSRFPLDCRPGRRLEVGLGAGGAAVRSRPPHLPRGNARRLLQPGEPRPGRGAASRPAGPRDDHRRGRQRDSANPGRKQGQAARRRARNPLQLTAGPGVRRRHRGQPPGCEPERLRPSRLHPGRARRPACQRPPPLGQLRGRGPDRRRRGTGPGLVVPVAPRRRGRPPPPRGGHDLPRHLGREGRPLRGRP